MKLSWFGRAALALVSALALGLSMSACGGGTIAYLWAVGQQHNQISGYKVDDYTGNLTAITDSPFSTNGFNPVDIVVKPGGRYVYVINQGSPQGSTVSSTVNSPDAGISVFSVGGNGSLTFQTNYTNLQGVMHLWAAFDSSGTYLFVLDKYGPPTVQPGTQTLVAATTGVITTYAVDSNTGRLTLVTQSASTPAGGNAPLYLPVGTNPIMMASGGGCLFTLNSADQSITPYSVSNGQLSTVTTGSIPSGASNATSINGNSTSMVVTDAGVNPGTSPGFIHPFMLGGTCNLTAFTGGAQPNDVTVSNPVYSFFDTSSKFLYILNHSTTTTGTTTPYSSLTAYSLQNGELAEISGSPFKSGAGPSCMVEDPTAKFLYTSNTDGTITGYSFTSTEGTLSDLSRGSTFTTGDLNLTCLALSGSVD